MLPAQTTPPAAASFLLAGNNPASPSPSVVSIKQAPAGAAGGVVLAVDGKRNMAARAAVVGPDASFSDGDLEPKELSGDVIKKVAEETSSLLRSLHVPKDTSVPEQASFSKEVEILQKVCDFIIEGAGFFQEDKEITMLIGVQARINILLNADNKQSPQDLLLSSMGQIKAKVEDHMSAQELSGDVIKKVAEETSSLLRSLRPPKDIDLPEQASFSKEVDTLQKVCDFIVEGAVFFQEDKAITMLLGVQARVNLLLNAENKQSPQDLLLSSMGQLKASAKDQDTPTARLARYNAGRKWIHETVASSPILKPAPTVCSDEEVKMVLHKTFALLETEPVNSTRPMAGLFYNARSNCRALMEEVEKNGVNDNTGVAIVVIHAMAIAVLGQHKKYFDYDDVPDDALLCSLRRLEVAVGDYLLGGPPAEESDD